MMLTCAEYNLTAELKENQIVVLILESPDCMCKMVNNLRCQCEGGEGMFVLSENGSILKIEKYMGLVVDPFSMRFNERKLLNKLYGQLEQYAADYMERKEEIHAEIVSLLECILGSSPYAGIDFNLELDWAALFKTYNVRFQEPEGELEQQIAEYIKLLAHLTEIKVLCLVNIKSFIAKEGLKEIYQMAFYNKIQLILIENVECEREPDEKFFIIDRDERLILK